MFLHSERPGGAIQRDTGPGGPTNSYSYSVVNFPGLQSDNMREWVSIFERNSRRLRLSEEQNFEAALEFLPSDKVRSYFNSLEDSEMESYDSLKKFLLKHSEPNIFHLMKHFSEEARASNISDLIKTAGRIVQTCPKEDIVMLLVSFLCPDTIKDRVQTSIKYGFERWQELVETLLERQETNEIYAAWHNNDMFKTSQDYENLDSAQYYIETQQSSKSAPAPMNSQFNSAVKQSGIMRDACVNTVVTLSQSYGGEKSKEFIDINHVDSKIKTGALNLSSSKHTPTTNVSKQFRKIKKKNENGTKNPSFRKQTLYS